MVKPLRILPVKLNQFACAKELCEIQNLLLKFPMASALNVERVSQDVPPYPVKGFNLLAQAVACLTVFLWKGSKS